MAVFLVALGLAWGPLVGQADRGVQHFKTPAGVVPQAR
jgi:hypothetical protein